jgi:hypothetical protein
MSDRLPFTPKPAAAHRSTTSAHEDSAAPSTVAVLHRREPSASTLSLALTTECKIVDIDHCANLTPATM